MGTSPGQSDVKRRAELDFWRGMAADLTRGCTSEADRRAALLAVCREQTFPRYLRDLYLTPESFDGQRVLDVGCGPHGGLIGFAGAERYGVDHLLDDYRALGYPLGDHGIDYRTAPSEALPFEDRFFDVVVSVNALDHVDDVDRTMAEIGRVLRRGGRLMAQVNFHPSPTPAEPHCLTHQQMTRLLDASGLQPTAILFQETLTTHPEHRYYYEARKGPAEARLDIRPGAWTPPRRGLFRRR